MARDLKTIEKNGKIYTQIPPVDRVARRNRALKHPIKMFQWLSVLGFGTVALFMWDNTLENPKN